jgi:hypothetical protein
MGSLRLIVDLAMGVCLCFVVLRNPEAGKG